MGSRYRFLDGGYPEVRRAGATAAKLVTTTTYNENKKNGTYA